MFKKFLTVIGVAVLAVFAFGACGSKTMTFAETRTLFKDNGYEISGDTPKDLEKTREGMKAMVGDELSAKLVASFYADKDSNESYFTCMEMQDEDSATQVIVKMTEGGMTGVDMQIARNGKYIYGGSEDAIALYLGDKK